MTEILEAPDGVKTWAQRTGWRPSKGQICLHWVVHGRCGMQRCRETINEHRWMDHGSSWIKEGERMMVCQPYYMGNAELADLLSAVDRLGLAVAIHGQGFYGHGSFAIELTPKKPAPSRAPAWGRPGLA